MIHRPLRKRIPARPRLLRKRLTIFVCLAIFVAGAVFVWTRLVAVSDAPPSPFVRELYAQRVTSDRDADHDSVDDYTDIVQNARAQIGVVTSYDTSYYTGGYPPAHTGACSDVIWRTLADAGYDLKQLLDDDMAAHPKEYPTAFDPNINFRRTQNIRVFLERTAQSLTTAVLPNDRANLVQWQGGDIVTFAQIPGRLWHIAIVSDHRRPDGVPYLIHNHGQGTLENNYLTYWPAPITGHFRFRL